MKVALLGATGFVGSALLKEALDRGHVVTAIVRHPEKLEKREGLTAKAGDVYDTASLATLIRGNEAIISAFNPGWKNPNLYDDQVRGTASIIAAIKKAGIKRVLWVGGAGGLEVKPGVRVIDSPDMPLWVKPGSLATINALDQLRKEPELEWSYLSPSAELKPGQRTGKFRLGNDQLLVDATGQSKISVQVGAIRLAVRPLHRSAHRACKIRNRTRPFALSNLHLIGMINQMIIGERLETFDGLRLVRRCATVFKISRESSLSDTARAMLMAPTIAQ